MRLTHTRRFGPMLMLGGLLALASPARAHDGPPYPILADRAAGSFRLSVWADPDVGTGTFFIYLEPGAGARPAGQCDVQLFVRPASGRLPEAAYRAVPRHSSRSTLRFESRIPFDRAEPWRVRVRVSGDWGSSEADTLVAVTPPGQGPVLDFILYLFPFVAVAFLFLKAMLKRQAPKATSIR